MTLSREPFYLTQEKFGKRLDSPNRGAHDNGIINAINESPLVLGLKDSEEPPCKHRVDCHVGNDLMCIQHTRGKCRC